MNVEILSNVTRDQQRIAVVEDGIIQEVFIENRQQPSVVGNIYIGRISRLLPGMQTAFVDIGLEKNAFVHIRDIPAADPAQPITQSLYLGQLLRLQITKDAIGDKGPKASCRIKIAGDFLVFVPNLHKCQLSHRISDRQERKRLIELISPYCQQDGYVVRTAAAGCDPSQLLQEIHTLAETWQSINRPPATSSPKAKAAAPRCLLQQPNILIRTINSYKHSGLDQIQIDDPKEYNILSTYFRDTIPNLKNKIHLSAAHPPLFTVIDSAITQALEKRVDMKSGGYLLIEQTEAMVTIDVNTGAFVGRKNWAQTVLQTNLDATNAVAQQVRLRGLAGIIIIDFIEMATKTDKSKIIDALQLAFHSDKAKINIIGFTELGIVQMTRERLHNSLAQDLCQPCPHCQGKGIQKTVETLLMDIYRAIEYKIEQLPTHAEIVIYAAPQVAEVLDERFNSFSLEMNCNLDIRPQAQYRQEQFDVIIV